MKIAYAYLGIAIVAGRVAHSALRAPARVSELIPSVLSWADTRSSSTAHA